MPSFYGVVLYSELIGVQYSGTRIGAVMVNGVALVAEVFSRPTVARAQQAPMGRWGVAGGGGGGSEGKRTWGSPWNGRQAFQWAWIDHEHWQAWTHAIDSFGFFSACSAGFPR